MHFVFNCICAAISCLTTSSISARSSAASYSSRTTVLRCTRTVFNSVSLVPVFPSTFRLLFFQLFRFFFIHSYTILFKSLHSFFPKKIINISFRRKAVMPFQVWFRNQVFNLNNSNQFLLQTIYQCQNSDAAHEDNGCYLYINK